MSNAHDRADVVVIGAGAIGLAIAREFALRGDFVVLAEKNYRFGEECSSRSSEVIHAGLYYEPGSRKAQLCSRGRDLLYKFCKNKGVEHSRLGKYVVATNVAEEERLAEIWLTAKNNGCEVEMVATNELRMLQRDLSITAALYSPSTGILDSHDLMLKLLADFENAGGILAYNSTIRGVTQTSSEVLVELEKGYTFRASTVVNACGLTASALAQPHAATYEPTYAKGSYFAYTGKTPFKHLIYPIPTFASLGIHLTLDLSGKVKFGPDLEWVEMPNYQVDEGLRDTFHDAITRYWPSCDKSKLTPDYAGVRPKVKKDGKLLSDFEILKSRGIGGSQVWDLLGIESPGLTSCLALAEKIVSETV